MKIRSENKLIEYLQGAILDNLSGLNNISDLVEKIINLGIWQKRYISQTGESFTFPDFKSFVEYSTPAGLGTTLKNLQRLCADNIQVLDLIDRTQNYPGSGGDHKSLAFKENNVTFESTPRGNSTTYSLKRLRNTCPELHKQVLDQKLSANEAMIKAGLRQKSLYISTDIFRAARTLQRHFSADEIKQLVDYLAI